MSSSFRDPRGRSHSWRRGHASLLLLLTVPSHMLLPAPSGHLGKLNAALSGEGAAGIPPQGPQTDHLLAWFPQLGAGWPRAPPGRSQIQ